MPGLRRAFVTVPILSALLVGLWQVPGLAGGLDVVSNTASAVGGATDGGGQVSDAAGAASDAVGAASDAADHASDYRRGSGSRCQARAMNSGPWIVPDRSIWSHTGQ